MGGFHLHQILLAFRKNENFRIMCLEKLAVQCWENKPHPLGLIVSPIVCSDPVLWWWLSVFEVILPRHHVSGTTNNKTLSVFYSESREVFSQIRNDAISHTRSSKGQLNRGWSKQGLALKKNPPIWIIKWTF